MLDFLTHLERARGLTRNTREAYRVDLLQFGAFLARRGVGGCRRSHHGGGVPRRAGRRLHHAAGGGDPAPQGRQSDGRFRRCTCTTPG